MLILLNSYLNSIGLVHPISVCLTIIVAVFSLSFLSWIGVKVARNYLSSLLLRMMKKSESYWARELSKYKVLNKFALLIPGILFYMASPSLSGLGHGGEVISNIQEIISSIYLVSIFFLIGSSFMDILVDTYEKYEISKRNPIRFYIQILKIILFSAAAIIALSILLNKSPLVFLTGLGAAMAVLLVVFKDIIVGFIASIQITLYDIARIGDWVTIPNFDADGYLEEISLTTVKIRNFDKSISTIPTHSLLSSGVKNWRGMKEAGGRRIKRSLNIDMYTLQFCTQQMMDRFSRIKILEEAHKSFKEYPQLTNLGVFRLYIREYLLRNQAIHHNNFTFLIRELQPTEYGIPLELYIFTKDTQTEGHEATQSDIFEHLIAAASLFELRVFQNPSGERNIDVFTSKIPVNQTQNLEKAS